MTKIVLQRAQKGRSKGKYCGFFCYPGRSAALPYTEKQHGMFTYFLLKKLQDTHGKCSYEELSQYIMNNVSEYSIRENNKDQVPQTSFSFKLSGEWAEFNRR